MKRRMLSVLLCAVMATAVFGCGSGAASEPVAAETEAAPSGEAEIQGETEKETVGVPAQFSAGWGDTSQAFDPLVVEETWTFEEMREKLGPIPVDGSELALAATIRSVDNVYWQALSDGYHAMAEKLTAGGVTTTMDIQAPMGESDTEGQLANMKDQVRQGVDLILASPISTSNCTEAVENAHNDNIPTIAVNNEFNGADMFIGPNSYDEGVVAADWADENVGEGECAIIMGLAGTDVVKNRTNGFSERLEELNSDIKVVDSQNADWDRNKAKDVAATMMKTYPNLKIICCNNDVMAMGAVEAVKESGKVLNQDMFVIGMDGTDEAYESIRKNELSATVSMFPFYESQMATECAVRILLGQEMPSVIWTPAMVTDSSNVDSEEADTIGWTDPTFE
ncbi:MAG: substrate-binding domain-containing protein [Clostridiales bacterium]|nr:substrate-binding domain-containing protein [Clostridiales bacterium]